MIASHSCSDLCEDCLYFAKLPMQNGDIFSHSLFNPSEALKPSQSLEEYGSLVWIACKGCRGHVLYPLITFVEYEGQPISDRIATLRPSIAKGRLSSHCCFSSGRR